MTQFTLAELGTSKGAVKKCFIANYDRPDDDEWANKVKALLASRRTHFTLDELEALIDVFNTGHHACVLDNPFDFTPQEVALHERLEAVQERRLELIHYRRLADAPKNLVD